MDLIFHHIDAFTDTPFSGNPAAVCILEQEMEKAVMQKIAAELNLPATTFLWSTGDKTAWNIRWFAPAKEIPLCGHGTLAAGHLLYESGKLPGDITINFVAQNSLLTARRVENRIELDFPAIPIVPADFLPEAGTILGTMPVGFYAADHGLFAELDSAETVRRLQPVFSELVRVGLGHLVITAKSDTADFDIVSRVFVPKHGIDEDQATGSAHCALGPFWSKKLNKKILQACQASHRGGKMEVEHCGNRVFLRGQAVTLMMSKMSF